MQDTAQAGGRAGRQTRQRDAEVVGVARDVQSAGKSSAEIAAAQQLSANELDNNVIIIIKRLFPSPPPAGSLYSPSPTTAPSLVGLV